MKHEHNHNHSPATGSQAELAMCPVMHVYVSKKEAKAYGLTRTYKDQTYYFCCNTCTSQFDGNPEKYV